MVYISGVAYTIYYLTDSLDFANTERLSLTAKWVLWYNDYWKRVLYISIVWLTTSQIALAFIMGEEWRPGLEVALLWLFPF